MSTESRIVAAAPGRVRAATPADLDAVASLFDAYRQFYGQASDVSRAWSFLATRMARDESVILLATAADAAETVEGFVQLYPSFTSVGTGRIWILNDLFVVPHARRRGVARRLLDAARRYAVDTKAVRIELTTHRDNRNAQRLYESAGYEPDDEFITYRLPV